MTAEHIVHAAEVYFMMKQTQNLNKNCHESYLQEFTTSSSDIETGEQSIGEVPILYNNPISNSVKEIEKSEKNIFVSQKITSPKSLAASVRINQL